MRWLSMALAWACRSVGAGATLKVGTGRGAEPGKLAHAAGRRPGLVGLLQSRIRRLRKGDSSFGRDGLDADLSTEALASLKGSKGHVSFYMYDLQEYEPRFFGHFGACKRKGADYMFVDALREHPARTWWYPHADVIVVPCLFETYRRCSSANTVEKPPMSLLEVGARASAAARARDIPENFEAIPWRMAFDEETSKCMAKVKNSEVFTATRGKKHFFLAADWSMQFGRTLDQFMFRNMTIGRIEAIDSREARQSNRHFDMDQAGCAVVVPFASDVAYVKNWTKRQSFEEWNARPNLVAFRFEKRQYTLFCNRTKCKDAVDATPLRTQALHLKKVVGERASIFDQRETVDSHSRDLHRSKFCLVIRGDTPSTHAFYDAVAADCIPVLVSDRWGTLAAPFAHGRHGVIQGGMDFSAFTVRIPEQFWLQHIERVAERLQAIEADLDRSKTLFYHLLHAKPSLLWSMPHADVGDSVLESAWKCSNLD